MKKLQHTPRNRYRFFRFWWWMISLGIFPGLMVFAPYLGAQSEIRLAVVGPSSGDQADYGERQLSAVRWAVEQINASGGIAGVGVVLESFDDGCDPEMAMGVAREVLAAGIRLIVGHLCSSATLAAAPIYEAGGALMITPAATDPALTQQGFERIFRILPTPDHQVASAVGFIRERLQPGRLAVLHDDSAYGELIGRSVVNQLQEAGVMVAFTATTVRGQDRFDRLVEVLGANGVEVVYYSGFAEELGLLLSQASQQGITFQVIGPDALASKKLGELAGAAADGVYLTLPAVLVAAQDEPLQAFIEEQGWENSPVLALASVASVRVFAAALELVGGGDLAALQGAVRQSVHATPLGLLGFDEFGDSTGFYYGVFRWQGGRVVPEPRR